MVLGVSHFHDFQKKFVWALKAQWHRRQVYSRSGSRDRVIRFRSFQIGVDVLL